MGKLYPHGVKISLNSHPPAGGPWISLAFKLARLDDLVFNEKYTGHFCLNFSEIRAYELIRLDTLTSF
tara:strand:- start:1139 stop:1342 length:204 start_codon:yes stop_codon:yes gene_type:complete